jgi:hypothetical protein
MEKYCVINGFDNYAISNYGNIKNIKDNKVLTPYINENGYKEYHFCQNGIRKSFKIHRLVALYFIDNPDQKPYVNHIDGDKSNNNASNLEWCTAKENDEHARNTGLKNENKSIVATNAITHESVVFASISEASGILGINKGTIHKVLQKKRNKTHNYFFEYSK